MLFLVYYTRIKSYLRCFLKSEFLQSIYSFYDKQAEKLIVDSPQLADGTYIKTRALLILWTCTTFVMWFYVLYSILAFPLSSPVPWGGLIFTLIHSISPYVFKRTQSLLAAGLNISLSGLGFQTLFCLFTGGVYSPAAIWLTFHPVILGFFGSTGWILFSVGLNTFIIATMYIAGHFGLLPLDELNPLFRDGMILTSYVGLDILVAIFTVTAIKINLKKNEELNKSKDMTENLVRVLCHDINNPLSIIQVASKKISPSRSKQSPQYAEKIIRAGNDIQRITQSVTSWISHKDGKQKLKHQLITVGEIIEHLQFAFEDQLKTKNLTMQINNSTDQDAIWGDKTALFYQVINNLISNAIKFSFEHSTIEINFSSNDQKVFIEVRDHGVGIKPDLIEKVFSPYAMTSNLGTRNEKGTGFGLPIVATVVERMNGSISIENMNRGPGEQGTRVQVVFPKL